MAVLKSTFSTLASKFLNDTFKDFAKSFSIIEEVDTDDGQGGSTTELVTFANTIGFIFPMVGKEDVVNGGLYTDQMFKFSLKPVTGLTNKMIISYTDNNSVTSDYKIESIENVAEANVWINVLARKDDNGC